MKTPLKNTHFKQSSAMIRVLVMIMFSLFLLGNVSAFFEIDNYKDYDSKTKTIMVKNGFTFGTPIAEVQLKTPLNMVVPRGYQKVAEFEIRLSEDYNNAFKELELYDKNKEDQKFIRSYDYKVRSYETINVNDYTSVCSDVWDANNGTFSKECSQVLSGTHEEQREVWTILNSSDFNKDDVLTIGIFTEVQKGDVVEWIPNLFGVRVDEWAIWTESLNVDIISFYKLNETSGVVLDSVGNNNGTNNGTTRGVAGIINNSFDFNGTTDYVDLGTNDFVGSGNYAISFWYKTTNTGVMIIQEAYSAGGIIFAINRNIITESSGWITYIGSGNSTEGVAVNIGADVYDGAWHHIVFVRDGDTSGKVYFDGVNVKNASVGTGSHVKAVDFILGANTNHNSLWFDGNLDEIGIWNRSLSASEVSDLYNGGSGITYSTVFVNIITTLISPIDAFISPSNIINFSVNSTPIKVNLTNVTLYIWNNTGELYQTNFTSLSGNESVNTTWTMTISDGSYIWNAQSYGTNGTAPLSDWGTNRTLIVDTTLPIISVTSPTGDQGTFVSGRNLSLNWTVIDPNQDTCWYEYGGSNTTVTCSDNSTNLTVTDSTKTSLIFYANDTAGNQNSNTTTWSYSFIEENVIYNVNVSETSSQTFTINMTTSIGVLSISSFLHYNDTNYNSVSSCSGDNCTLTNTFDVPLILLGESQINIFHWNITIFNGTDSINIETSSRTQNVSRIHLEECNATYTTQSLNFTAYNEQNLTRVNPYRFDGTFDIWIGTGSVKRNNSFSQSSIAEETLCIFPNAIYFTDAQIEYNEAINTTFTTRDYFFQNNTINNISQNIFLYLLPSVSSTSFILKIQDNNLLPLEDYLIETQRYYPGTDEFKTVQISKTADNGKTVGFFETETVDYRFVIKYNGQTLLTTTKRKIVGEETPFTITFTIGEDLGKPWKTLEDLTNLDYSLDFDKLTNIVTYTYIDASENFTLGSLVVERQNFSFATNTILCNLNSSQSSATITCDLTGNSTGTYIAKSYITRGSVEELVKQFSFIIETFSDIVGMLGVLLAWFLIVISSFAFKFNEIAGIFMINATIIFVNLIGLVSFGMLSISALIAVSIIIVVVMEK